uniref:FBXO47 ARM repeats region domain-containing protein n=1 Tax=Caenorhabditis japonica TaxID=281687 RepID=A0A8R1DUW4_CAEJA
METPSRRIYNLRSAHRTATPPLPLRKRVSGFSNDGKAQKRKRTQQSIGPAFTSPDPVNPPRNAQIEEQRVFPSLTKRLSDLQEKPYGRFGRLPTDVIFQIMHRTPYHLLGSMAMTSNAWMEVVYAYVGSGSFRVRCLSDITNVANHVMESNRLSRDPFYSMGKLVRRMTFKHDWHARLALLQSFLEMFIEVGVSEFGLGRLIRAFAECSDEDIVTDQIDDLVTMVLSVVPTLRIDLDNVIKRADEDRQLGGLENLNILQTEFETRTRTIALFLSNGSGDPSFGLNKFFLSSLMKVFKIRHDSLPTSLFYLLFAPTTIYQNSEVVNWHRLSQISVSSLDDAQELKPLSKALYALLLCRNLKNALPWTRNTIFNLMEEVTTYPSPWSMNTFVSLQVLEPELVPIGVIARMHRNHEDEAGDMICTMKMLLFRWEMDVIGVMERVMETIKTGLKTGQRRSLFDRCWEWHQKNIDDLRRRVGRFSDIRAEIESQIEVMPVLVKLL